MLPRPSLDPRSEVPLYQQLYRHFIELIHSGALQRGERLPPTRELAGLLGLNRTTISAAYGLLEAAGFINGHVGRGSFVTGGMGPTAGLNWENILGPRSFITAPSFLSDPNVISFAVSCPSETLFPLDDWRASCDEVLSGPDLSSVLQLGSPGGYEPLRQYLMECSRNEDVLGEGDDIMITSGCQQALDLTRRVLIRPGEKVLLEEPVFPGLRNLFVEAEAHLTGIPVHREGMDVAQLARTATGGVRAIVLTSNFQNPTGATLPQAARESVLRVAQSSGAVLIENDIYGQLRYEGEPLPTLKQMDDTGDTILLRSFSKISFPGLRVGWVIGPRPVIARMMEAKQLSDLHSDQFSQAVLLRFALSGRQEKHHIRIRKA